MGPVTSWLNCVLLMTGWSFGITVKAELGKNTFTRLKASFV